MKIRGMIKLEITGSEAERPEVDKLIEDLTKDPNLSMCKIKVTRIMKGAEVYLQPKRKKKNGDTVAQETAAS